MRYGKNVINKTYCNFPDFGLRGNSGKINIFFKHFDFVAQKYFDSKIFTC